MNDIKCIIEDVEKSNIVSTKVINNVINIIGQEEWNDLYDIENDICTTTGELIIALKGIVELNNKMKQLLTEIYSEFGFSELVRIRNGLPIEILDVIEETKENVW